MNAFTSKEIYKRKTAILYHNAVSTLHSQGYELRQAAQSPLGLATAFALGTLTSFLPVPILDSLLAFGLAAKFERLNKAAIFLARAIWNDLLVVPLYAPGYKLGQRLLLGVLDPQAMNAAYQEHFLWLSSFLLGAAILAGLAAFLGFVMVLLIVNVLNSGKFKFNRSERSNFSIRPANLPENKKKPGTLNVSG